MKRDSDELLDYQAVADRLGIARTSVEAYRWRGIMPEPDRVMGRSPCWRASTIEDWIAGRPGRGVLRNGKPEDRLLDYAAIGDLIGVSARTVCKYRWRGVMPEPDKMLGRSPCWYTSTIVSWVAQRPGSGRVAGS